MDNGTSPQVVRQFDLIAKLPDTWDHNQHYQKFLMKHIGQCDLILDVGCGTGELTKLLSEYGKRVVGIDVSPEMIEMARRRNGGRNIEYYVENVESFLNRDRNKYDVIVSVAALHHMDERAVLRLMKDHLSEKGTILVLDLFAAGSVIDHVVSIMASIMNPLVMLMKRGRLGMTKDEKEVWKDHFQYDKYKTIGEMKEICLDALGDARIRRHLFWRYSIVHPGK